MDKKINVLIKKDMNDKCLIFLSLFEEGVLIITMILSTISMVLMKNITIMKTNDEVYSLFDISSEGIQSL